MTRNFTCYSNQRYRCADGFVGGLVGVNAGTISRSWVTGAVSNTITNGTDNSRISQAAVAGGLVGYAHGSSVIAASYSAAGVAVNHTPKSSVRSQAGGLVGANDGTVIAAYATGAVQSNLDASLSLAGHVVGGPAGHNGGGVTASYATGTVPTGFARSGLVGHNAGGVTAGYWDTTASGVLLSAAGTPKTTTELQAPTEYAGIYQNWNVDLDRDGNADDPWSFGTSSDYPTLTGVSNQQVGAGAGDQQQQQAVPGLPGPVTALELTATADSVTVSWQAPEIGEAPTRYIVHLRPEGGNNRQRQDQEPQGQGVGGRPTRRGVACSSLSALWMHIRNTLYRRPPQESAQARRRRGVSIIQMSNNSRSRPIWSISPGTIVGM